MNMLGFIEVISSNIAVRHMFAVTVFHSLEHRMCVNPLPEIDPDIYSMC